MTTLDWVTMICGFVIGVGFTVVIGAVLLNRKETPPPDYIDLEYERWKIQRQAEAVLKRN